MPTNREHIRATLRTAIRLTVDEAPLTEANGPVGTPGPVGPEPTMIAATGSPPLPPLSGSSHPYTMPIRTTRTKSLLEYIALYKIPNKANGALDSDQIRKALTGHSFRVRLHQDLVEKWHHLYTNRLDRAVSFKLEKTTVYKNGQKLSQTHWVSEGVIYNPNLTDPENQSQLQLEIPENSLFSQESLVNILENRYIFA